MDGNGRKEKSEERGAKSEFDALEAIDLATMTEDKVCIQRDHATGDLSWRFACPQADPIGMLFRMFFHQMMAESGWRERIEALEQRVKELEGR